MKKIRFCIVSIVSIPLMLMFFLVSSCNHKAKGTSFENEDLSFIIDSISFTMKPVEGGTFTIGGTSEQADECQTNENSARKVTVSDFWIGETEVTQALWQAVMGTTFEEQREKATNGSTLVGTGPDYPMCYVNYADAIRFCHKLNSKLGDQLPSGWCFSLPTEAQWEYAARGGKYLCNYKYAGSNDIGNVAWYCVNTYGIGMRPVKRKLHNALGLYDMSGSVNEWCVEGYIDQGGSPQADLPGLDSLLPGIWRGGCWQNSDKRCEVSYRPMIVPKGYFDSNGFRLVLVQQ